MTDTHSTPKKRGRPFLTKQYDNPLDSPEAHSSLAVAKTRKPNFIIPMMKVSMTSPTKRRKSNHVTSHIENVNSAMNSPMVTGKGWYRGVLLEKTISTSPSKKKRVKSANQDYDLSTENTTARKESVDENAKNSSSEKEESSKIQVKELSKTIIKDTQNDKTDVPEINKNEKPSKSPSHGFNLSLNLDSNGKASIGNFIFKSLSNPKEEPASPPSSASNANYDNHPVLKIPRTPRASMSHSILSGTTPIFTLDQLLSPRNNTNSNINTIRRKSLTQDNNSLNITVPTFNTPPSFLNLGSPNGFLFSPFNKRRNSNILMINDDVMINNNNGNKSIKIDPQTPWGNDETLVRSSVPWSPYVQSLMEHRQSPTKNSFVNDNDNDDARLALKHLINDK